MDTRPRYETAQDSRQKQTTSSYTTAATTAADKDEDEYAQTHKMNSHVQYDEDDKHHAMMRTTALILDTML